MRLSITKESLISRGETVLFMTAVKLKNQPTVMIMMICLHFVATYSLDQNEIALGHMFETLVLSTEDSRVNDGFRDFITC